MAATELSRSQLTQEFRDGERPSGEDFASAWLSFINKTDDGVKIDSNGNVEVARGLKLKDTPIGDAGTLRFNGGQVQFHDGTSFKSLSSGSAGAFTPVGAGPHVSFGGGNVGIGAFVTPPTHKLEINLGANTSLDQRVKFGNIIAHNGSAAAPGAYVSHTNQGGDTSFALFQDNQGNTSINAALNAQLILSQNAVNRFRALVSGDIIISPATSVTLAGNVAVGSSAANRNLTVFGEAFKNVSGPFSGLSDKRVKKDIRPYKEGLEKLLAINPVVYKFNGKASTPNDGKDYVGIIAQDAQKVLPDLFFSRTAKLEETDKDETDVLAFQPGPLTYIMINAIRELSARIDKLENPSTNAKRKSKNSA